VYPGRSLSSIAYLLAFATSAGAQELQLAQPQGRDWQGEVVQVHARFHGRPGTFAQFGDSITETLAFWTPLRHARKNASPRMEHAFRLVDAHLRPECWRDWKGPEFGNQGGRTIGWAEENVAAWLERLNPEVVLVMFGTNDLSDLEVNAYRDRLRSVVRRCLDRGTVVILSTIPPRHGFAGKAAEFAAAASTIARELSLPLVDFHAEVLKRRPNDWDGATDDFKGFDGYDVPTLLARDGVHPSAPRLYEDDYSEKALGNHGYGLRNYLVLMKYAEVLEALTAPRPATGQAMPRCSPRLQRCCLHADFKPHRCQAWHCSRFRATRSEAAHGGARERSIAMCSYKPSLT
jgi:GDSL-like Lipase/Acylhydrolase family